MSLITLENGHRFKTPPVSPEEQNPVVYLGTKTTLQHEKTRLHNFQRSRRLGEFGRKKT